MLDVHRLRIFRAVVTCGSVHQAAANLGYTPSAISQQLAALQRETGLRLIERDGRGIKPTAVGRRLAEEAGDVLERLSTLESVVAGLRTGQVDYLAINYFASVGSSWIPRVVAAVKEEFPDVRLGLRLLEASDQRHSEPDLEVFVRDGQETPHGYTVEPLIDDPYVVVLPSTHPLATRKAVPLRELAGESWVDNDSTGGTCRQIVIDACTSIGFAPVFQMEAHGYATAIAFVAVGLGITVVPRLGVGTSLPPGVVAVPVIEPTPRRSIAVRVRDAVADRPAVRRFVELLRKEANGGASPLVGENDAHALSTGGVAGAVP